MGGISAMNSINRVLEAHAEEIRQEYLAQVPASHRDTVTDVLLSNNTYRIEVEWQLAGGHTSPGPSIDIDTLQESYPDCNVAY